MNKNTEEQTKHKFENNLCIPCRDLGKVHVKRKKKFDSVKFKEAAYALREEQSMDLKKQILTILFKHRANDRGNKHLNLIEDSKELEEQDGYYADKLLKLITDREKELLEKVQDIIAEAKRSAFPYQDAEIPSEINYIEKKLASLQGQEKKP